MAKFVSLLAATAIATEQAYHAAAPVQAVAAVSGHASHGAVSVAAPSVFNSDGYLALGRTA